MIITPLHPNARNIVAVHKVTGDKLPAITMVDTVRRIIHSYRLASTDKEGVYVVDKDAADSIIIDERCLDDYRIEHLDCPGIEWAAFAEIL